MKRLIVLGHYSKYKGHGLGAYRQTSAIRANVVAHVILSAHAQFGTQQFRQEIVPAGLRRANQAHNNELKMVIVTDGEHHVLEEESLQTIKYLFEHVPVRQSDPMLVLHDAYDFLLDKANDNYDQYVLQEDDLIYTDPRLLDKVKWFTKNFGVHRMLHPHRVHYGYALGQVQTPVHKLYADGEIGEKSVAASPNWYRREFLAVKDQYDPMRWVNFERPYNPHAGIIILEPEQRATLKPYAAQMRYRTNFSGPLESGTTGKVLPYFEIYKAMRENAYFCEILHGADERPIVEKWARYRPLGE
jgi:hypothetical protein